MIDQLIQAAKDQLTPQLQQAGVKPDQLNGVFNVAQESVTDGLKNQAMSGNFDSLLSMFNGQGGAQSGSLISSIGTNFVQSMVSKLGLSPSIANQVSNLVIPFIMNKFSSSDTGTASNPSDLMSKLGMDSDDGISGALSGLLGGKGGTSDLLGGLGKLF